MKREKLLQELAPCGLDCGRCVRYRQGSVAKAARELAGGLEGFGAVAASRYAVRYPELAGFPQFEAVLGFLAAADCPGCRNDASKCWPECTAKNCHREKGVDFCADCDAFPCERNQFPEMFKSRWLTVNRRIQEIGAGAYYLEQLKKPRY
jgi:hypothetical protein